MKYLILLFAVALTGCGNRGADGFDNGMTVTALVKRIDGTCRLVIKVPSSNDIGDRSDIYLATLDECKTNTKKLFKGRVR